MFGGSYFIWGFWAKQISISCNLLNIWFPALFSQLCVCLWVHVCIILFLFFWGFGEINLLYCREGYWDSVHFFQSFFFPLRFSDWIVYISICILFLAIFKFILSSVIITLVLNSPCYAGFLFISVTIFAILKFPVSSSLIS